MANYKFKQGSINPSALTQGEHWFDKDGALHYIDEMSPYHAVGACNKLYKQFGRPVISSILYKALLRRVQSA